MNMNPIKINCLKGLFRGKVSGLLFAAMLLGSPAFSGQVSAETASGTTEFAVQQQNERTVTGVVKDKSGEPLIGVNVVLKGTATGTITGLDGDFMLQVPSSGVLEISYIGYKTVEVKLTSSNTYEVVLREDTEVLSEVVVTAMGIERKASSLTYATQTVKNTELTRARDVNFVNALQGKSAGLTITPNSSGAGGGASKILLRGQSSMIGNNQPLIVLDGVPLANGMQSQVGAGSLEFGGARDGGDILSTINPDDVASMTILKGANAAALYGSAANNGVIVITTKGGRQGNLRVDVSSNSTFERVIMLPELQTTYGGTINGYNGVSYDGWGPALSSITADQMSRYPYLTNDSGYDKLKDFYGTGMTFTNSVALSGGTEKMSTYFSYANTTQRGVFEQNKFKRHNIMFKQTYNLFNNKLHLDFSLNYINQRLNNRPSVGKAFSPIFGMYRTPANIDMRYFKNNYSHTGTLEDEMVSNINVGNRHLINEPIQTWEWYDQYVNNPYWILNMLNNETITNRLLSSFTAKYDIIEGLSAQARLSVEQNFIESSDSKYATTNRDSRIKSGISYVGNSWNRNIFSDYLLTYNKRFLDKIDFNVTAGASLRRVKSGSVSTYNEMDTAAIYPNIFLPQNDKARTDSKSGTTTQTWDNNWETAIFATTQIGFWDYAYIDASFRTDWSKAFQQFAEDGKYKSFSYWSLGANVLLKDLIAKHNDKVNNLKLRASYSVVGNSIPNVVYAAQTLDFASGALSAKAAPFHNPKPETTTSYEVGFDGAFFNNAFDFDVTFYNTVLDNQVMQISTSSGQSQYVNSGKVRNRGIEVTANYNWRINNDWSWYTGITFAYNKNKILETYTPEGSNVPNPIELDISNRFRIKFVEGGSYGDIYMNEIMRDENGNMLVDQNGNPRMTSDYSKKVGNNTANTTFGWHNTFTWKNLSLYVLLDGKIGGKVVSMTEAELDAYGLSQRTADARNNNPEGLTGINNGRMINVPWQNYYTTIGTSMTEDYVYDATNIRVREISLGYTFRDLFGPSKSLSVSVIARNLGFIYKNSPVDPDISVTAANALSGIDIYSLPTTRSFGINLKATF